jgi:hypothetical protein
MWTASSGAARQACAGQSRGTKGKCPSGFDAGARSVASAACVVSVTQILSYFFVMPRPESCTVGEVLRLDTCSCIEISETDSRLPGGAGGVARCRPAGREVSKCSTQPLFCRPFAVVLVPKTMTLALRKQGMALQYDHRGTRLTSFVIGSLALHSISVNIAFR